MRQSDAMQAANALAALRDAIEMVTDPVPGRHSIGAIRDELLVEVEETISILAGGKDRRALVVIVGATGTGKSSLLNGLAGSAISPTGIRRPTTARPVVWHQGPDRPSIPQEAVYVEGSDPLLEVLVLIDTPDFDSTVEGHRETVEALLRQADLCVFVASAKRYADQAAWSVLTRARRRGNPIYLVLNRLPPDGADDILDDYVRHLQRGGLLATAESPRLLLVAEQNLAGEGLPTAEIVPLRRYLESLRRADQRRRVLAKAQAGRFEILAFETQALASTIESEAKFVRSLRDASIAAFAVATERLRELLDTQPSPEQLETSMIGLGESAVAATALAWSLVGVDVTFAQEVAEFEEKAKKALSEWHGRRPEDRSADDLAAVFDDGANSLCGLADAWAPPRELGGILRELAQGLRDHA